MAVDHINMASDEYNSIQGELDPQENLLLNENVQKQSVPRKKISLGYPRKSSTTHRQSMEEEPIPQDYSAAPFEFSLEKLQTLVEESFCQAQKVSVGQQHPSRDVKAKRVLEVLPDFDSIDKQYTQISGIDLLNQQEDQ